ncbi:MAG: anti-sigma factor family protein [Candidatus Sulfotelmatobacter sp.]
MDHDTVVREKMTEKYLLEELAPELRDEYEAHFFDCPECARDVHAGSEFIVHSKSILAESSEPAPVFVQPRVAEPAPRSWFAWLRPAFAIPALALLLVVIGYQNLVTLPHLMQVVNRPQVLPATTLNLMTYGENASPLMVHTGEGFLLNVIIPPGHSYTGYKVYLHNPAGGVESVAIPASAAASGEDTWPIRFPGTKRQDGIYKLTVRGLTSSGQDVEVGSSSFQLQVQK